MLPFQRLTLSCFLTIAQAVSAQPAPTPAQDNQPASSALDDALFYQLLLAELNQNQGEAGTAFALLLDAARKTTDVQLYHRAVDIALQARAGDAALQAARAWQAAEPASLEANRYVLQILIGLNRIEETLQPLKLELAALSPEARLPSLAAIARQFLRAGDKKIAASVVEKALADDLKDPATAGTAWSVVGRMRLLAGDAAGAEQAASRIQGLDRPAEGAALLGLALMTQKLPSGEPLLLNQLQSRSDPDLRLAYARLLMQLQRHADAATQIRLVLEQSPEQEAAWLIQGSMQLQNQQDSEAHTSLLRYLALVERKAPNPSTDERHRGTEQAYLYLADIATRRKDYAAAQRWLSRIDNAEEIVSVQTRRATLLARQGMLAEARQLIQTLPAHNAEEARAKLLSEAQLLREAKQYRTAYDLLRQASPGDALDADVLYEQAMLAEKLGELGEMERLLRTVIAAKPDYHHAYNALGYSLAERNLRLPEARQLIQKALEFAPGDPFISDSLGWVEFRLGNGTQAVQILESAYQSRPDAEIAAHLGEVLWSLGQKSRAVTVWKEGWHLSPENETLAETLQRLHVKW
jgi:tetratricopeptide (TPR) repeat protein